MSSSRNLLTLTYLGEDSWSRPVYRDQFMHLWKDTGCGRYFCEESPEFAEVVYKTKRTLSDCCTEVLKGVGNHISDIDVYRGIVKSYFPNADVRFLMNIEINGAAPSEEEMARVPEKPKPSQPKPVPKAAPEPAEKAAVPSVPKPAEPEIIQLSLF